MKLVLLIIIMFFCFSVCSSQAVQPKENDPKSAARSGIQFEILKWNCFEGHCLGLGLISDKNFGLEDIKCLGADLKYRYKEKSNVTLLFFDDEELARAYVDGKRDVSNLSLDFRIRYITKELLATIQFKPDKSNANVVNSLDLSKNICSCE